MCKRYIVMFLHRILTMRSFLQGARFAHRVHSHVISQILLIFTESRLDEVSALVSLLQGPSRGLPLGSGLAFGLMFFDVFATNINLELRFSVYGASRGHLLEHPYVRAMLEFDFFPKILWTKVLL